ncbi:hypothetical protein Tco_1026969 [Tanacetum coccineum]
MMPVEFMRSTGVESEFEQVSTVNTSVIRWLMLLMLIVAANVSLCCQLSLVLPSIDFNTARYVYVLPMAVTTASLIL